MKVSVIMPNFNGIKFIEYSIFSVIHQTYTNWELIIIDDCSTDNSIKIINQFTDTRIKLLKNPRNIGAANSRNKGIEYASGDVITFLDSDDTWASSKLERILVRDSVYFQVIIV
jgi:glycosyltransferase involved in cell wall biosynthesis